MPKQMTHWLVLKPHQQFVACGTQLPFPRVIEDKKSVTCPQCLAYHYQKRKRKKPVHKFSSASKLESLTSSLDAEFKTTNYRPKTFNPWKGIRK